LKLLGCGGTHHDLLLLKSPFEALPILLPPVAMGFIRDDREDDDVVMNLDAAGLGLAFAGHTGKSGHAAIEVGEFVA
jgi:hypothetical protein